MKVIRKIAEWQKIHAAHDNSQAVGFVATMGNLHDGHLSLVNRSLSENDVSVVSIFVNPTQFNQAEDFAKYPRTLEEDLEKLKKLKVDYVLAPEYTDLFPFDHTLQLWENQISTMMEGRHRPSHFSGVLTVLMKFFHLIQPSRAYFGEKDYQQLDLIQRMAGTFFMSIDVIGCPTVREASGLALSSRNSRLSDIEKKHAATLHQLLASHYPDGVVSDRLKTEGFKVDYIETHNQRRYGAVWLGNVRLIDNVVLEEVHDPVY